MSWGAGGMEVVDLTSAALDADWEEADVAHVGVIRGVSSVVMLW